MQLTLLQCNDGHVPTFDQTIQALGSIPAILYRALEFGTAQNQAFFEVLSQKERPRPHIREMIIRDQAKRFLQRNNFQVDDEAVKVGNEPMAALMIRCGPVQIRVLKGSEGLIPGCGDSERRRTFYNQGRSLYWDKGGTISQTRLNLVLLWDFDKSFNLSNLWLACPMRAGESSSEVLLHWQEILEHPAVTISSAAFDQARSEAEDELEKLFRHDDAGDEEEIKEA